MIVNSLFASNTLLADFGVRLTNGIYSTLKSWLNNSLGLLNRQISTAGVNPASTGGDIVLAVYSLPANALNFNSLGGNACLDIKAAGAFAANGNTKTVKLIANPSAAVVGSAVTGGTTIASTGAVATNSGGWMLKGRIYKYGADNSNTQMAVSEDVNAGAVSVGVSAAPALITAVENAPILIAVTGNAATTATDITFNLLEVLAMN